MRDDAERTEAEAEEEIRTWSKREQRRLQARRERRRTGPGASGRAWRTRWPGSSNYNSYNDQPDAPVLPVGCGMFHQQTWPTFAIDFWLCWLGDVGIEHFPKGKRGTIGGSDYQKRRWQLPASDVAATSGRHASQLGQAPGVRHK
jgi:hypothetical protein